MIEMRRGKKSVVRVAQRVAALVPVQGSSSHFPNMYCFFDPSSTFVRFSVQNCSDRPLNHMVMRLSLSPPWYHSLFLSRIHIRIGICSYMAAVPVCELISNLCVFATDISWRCCRYTIVHKTEVIKNNLNPTWRPFTVSVGRLSQGDSHR